MERHERGQPMLIGTASVAKSELLSRLLDKRGIAHKVLNAKQHFREAEIVAQAGRLGAVTVATNMAGRGVDIILGGNAELLAQHEVAAEGVDLDNDEGTAELEQRQSAIEARCRAEGEEVRKLGGLYVLGSERHESRRIDNQLRGRSGRQGDPGESRFYLSLDDELLRLFATGAMSWVMGRTLPEDVPIESKTVAKAIERAQNTVEARNAEIRKDDLKYDEVMDQQRKVIYERRLQIIDGEDLEEHTEDLLAGAAEKLVSEHCPTDFAEDWDLKALIDGLMQYYPTKFAVEDLAQAATTEDLVESIVDEALDYYEKHSEAMPGGAETMRQIERDVYLQIMDARWRDHLAEMDNLKDGIHLRWTVQADPLNAWQQEGFSMFGQLMEVIDNDYLRYILHVEAVQAPAAEPDLDKAVYAAAEGPVAETARWPVPSWPSRAPRSRRRRPPSLPRPAGTAAAGVQAPRRRSSSRTPPTPTRWCPSSSSSTRRSGATIPAGAGAARSSSSAMAPPDGPAAEAPRDFTAELEALGERLAEAERYLGREKLEVRRAELEAEVAQPDLWDDPDDARARSPRSSAGCPPTSTSSMRCAARSGTPGRCSSSPRSPRPRAHATSRSRPNWWRRSMLSGRGSVHSSCSRSSRASTTSSTRCARCTPAPAAPTRRTGPRCCCACTSAGRSAAASPSRSTRRPRARRRACCRPPSSSTVASPTVCWQPSAACTAWSACHPSTPSTAARRASPPWTSSPSSRTCPREVEIDEKDLRIDTYRSSGAGGQHVNKTDSAVRLTHLPTGIVVSCQNERSQHQNKAKAMQILGAKLAERARAERRAELDALSGERVDNAWGNQIRSYVMAPYQLVKDLRTGYETGNVDAVLDGDLDAFMEAELRRQREVGA